jgi:hypothetical protein
MIFTLNRGCANTRYSVDQLSFQSSGRHKAEQLIAGFNSLRLFTTSTDSQKTKAAEFAVAYNEQFQELIANPAPNKDKIAFLISETLDKVYELCNEVITNPVVEPVEAPPVVEAVAEPLPVVEEIPRKRGRPKKDPHGISLDNAA